MTARSSARPPAGVGFGLRVGPGAITRTESLVTHSRARVLGQRIVDRDQRLIDNAKDPASRIAGIDSWLDKIKRMRVFTFPKRYLLDFEIPEPAVFVRLFANSKPKPGVVRTEQIPLPDTGKEDCGSHYRDRRPDRASPEHLGTPT